MTAIEWAEETWNPIAGCSDVSAGCTHCYARTMAGRLEAMGSAKYAGLTIMQGSHRVWTGKIAFDKDALLKPLLTRKPTRWFVNSMSDWCHPNVSDGMRDRMMAVCALCPQHEFLFLTKRAETMRGYLAGGEDLLDRWQETSYELVDHCAAVEGVAWPLPNVWLGVSAENQATADERIPLLLQTPAAVRFVSAEPLLGAVNLKSIAVIDDTDPDPDGWRFSCLVTGDMYHTEDAAISDGPEHGHLDWVIVGGESGPEARKCDVRWINSIVQQCAETEVPVFVKQLGRYPMLDGKRLRLVDRKGGEMAEWPEYLRVRQIPKRPQGGV